MKAGTTLMDFCCKRYVGRIIFETDLRETSMSDMWILKAVMVWRGGIPIQFKINILWLS